MAEPLGPECDTPGCGAASTYRSTGEEEDARALGRRAIPRLNVCDHHRDFIFSGDALALIEREHAKYKTRK